MEKTIKARFVGRIQKPVTEVFGAIVSAERIANYFVSRSSGPLVAGKTVTWYFDDAGAELTVLALQIEPNKRIVFQWNASGTKTRVEINVREIEGGTEVYIREGNWPQDVRGVAQALGQASGWTDFFDSLKAYLLFNVDLRRGVAHVRLPVETERVVEEQPAGRLSSDGGARSHIAMWTVLGLAAGFLLGAGSMFLMRPTTSATPPALYNTPSTFAPASAASTSQMSSSTASGKSATSTDLR